MFSFSLDRIKEIPDELKVIETVIPPHMCDLREEPSENKFLIAEYNCTPEYVIVKGENFSNRSEQSLFFYDVEDLSIKQPQNLENEKKKDFKEKGQLNKITSNLNFNFDIFSLFEKSISYAYNYISNINIKQKLRLGFSQPNEGFDKLSEEEIHTRQIKLTSINSLGNLAALVNRYNKLMIIDLENKLGNVYDGAKLNPLNKISPFESEIVDLQWHSIKKNTLLIAYKNFLLQIFNLNSKREEICFKSIEISNIKKIKYSPCGEMLFIIFNSGKSFCMLKSHSFDNIHNKNTPLDCMIDIEWAPDSSYFIIFTQSTLFLYNTLNLSEKVWKDFLGPITSINISEDSLHFLVFTKDSQCPVYMLYNKREDYFNPNLEKKFSNIPQYYLHNEFKTSHKVFSLWFDESHVVIKTKMNSSNSRLVVQYKDITSNKTQLKVFEIRRNHPIHQTKIYPICNIKNFRGMDVTDFEFFRDAHNDDVLLILWNDRILSKSYLNLSNRN